MTSNFKTNDWQWFLQDIETQLELQMHPDSNEVERYQADQRARGGRSGSSQPSQTGLATSSSSTLTFPSFFGGGSSSGTTNGGGRSASQSSPVDSALKDRLLGGGGGGGGGGRSGASSSRGGANGATGGAGSSYGTFFDVHTTGTLNGHDEEEEMPVLPSAVKKSSSSRARLPDSHR